MRSSKIVFIAVLGVSRAVSSQVASNQAFGSVRVGPAFEQAGYNLRSTVGVALAVEAGRTLWPELELAARFSGERFGAPGGAVCVTLGGCGDRPDPSDVYALALGVDVKFVPPASASLPYFAVGAGARHTTESPARNWENRPYIEAGIGFREPPRGHAVWTMDLRYQHVVSTGTDMPSWTLPITVGLYFW